MEGNHVMYIIVVYIYPLHHLTYRTPPNDDVCGANIYINKEKIIKIICNVHNQDIYIQNYCTHPVTFSILMGYVPSINVACCSFNESMYLHHNYEKNQCYVHN